MPQLNVFLPVNKVIFRDGIHDINEPFGIIAVFGIFLEFIIFHEFRHLPFPTPYYFDYLIIIFLPMQADSQKQVWIRLE